MPSPLPPILSAAALQRADIPPPVPLVQGLFNKGEKVILIGSSKSNKSWSLFDMGLCISTGLPWWGIPTVQGKVLYLNFEVDDWHSRLRMQEIAKARGIDLNSNEHFHMWNLAGHECPYLELCAKIKVTLGKDHGFSCIIIDPLYCFNSSDKDENSATDMAAVLRAMTNLQVELKVAIVFAHHSPKGDMEERSVVDRASGSGMFGRNPSTIIDVRQIKGTFDQFKASFVMRNFAPKEPIGLRFAFPVMTPDSTIDVMNKANDDRSAELLKILPASGYTSKDWQQAALERLDMSRATFHRQKSDLHLAEKIEVVDGVWVPMTPGKVVAQ